ncbi:MAG: hypothetical protein QOI87_1912 [Bradyrhizobium sp.]|nr:hypothetical protein [Bradyrhizobium sp.]
MPIWKCVVVGIIAFTAAKLQYGRRVLSTVTLVLQAAHAVQLKSAFSCGASFEMPGIWLTSEIGMARLNCNCLGGNCRRK